VHAPDFSALGDEQLGAGFVTALVEPVAAVEDDESAAPARLTKLLTDDRVEIVWFIACVTGWLDMA